QANLGLISGLVGRGDVVFLDKLDHASIVDGAKLSHGETVRFNHGDMAGLERKLQKVPVGTGVMIIVDGVFSMEGDIADVPNLLKVGFEIAPTETPIVPFLIGDFEKTLTFWRKLFDAGVFTNPVVPPAVPPTQSRLRTSVMATHTADQLDFALQTFGRLGKELGVI